MLKTQCLPVRILFEVSIDQEYNRQMKIRKAYKFKLKPSPVQSAQLHDYVGHCRFLWNKVLALNLHRLKNKEPLMWYHEADYWSKLWKASEEFGFLKEAPAHCLQQKLKDLNKAFKDAFDKNQPNKRLPKFKKRGLGDSIRFPEPKHIHIDNKHIKLPKLGWVAFRKSRAIDGDIKNATLSRKAGGWYISIQVEMDLVSPKHPAGSAIGIDLGIEKYVAKSDGGYEMPVHAYRKLESGLAKAQKRLSRKKRYSQNWRKQQLKIQKIHAKIAHIRQDFQHKLSTRLSKNHALIVVEALKVNNMSRSASGSIETPGKNVSAKSGLNKAILDQGWSEFKRQLKYKLEWLGGVFLEVDPRYTSQRCSVCLYKDNASRKTQKHFCCVSCGHEENADINAAKNILAAGHAVLACGEDALVTSVKQEPLVKGNLVPA
jgi:putative transposase